MLPMKTRRSNVDTLLSFLLLRSTSIMLLLARYACFTPLTAKCNWIDPKPFTQSAFQSNYLECTSRDDMFLYWMCIPEQLNPSPVNPLSHIHTKDPIVLLHVAFPWQVSLMHSFTSRFFKKNPKNSQNIQLIIQRRVNFMYTHMVRII